MQVTTDPLLEWRDEFPILSHTNYLINNSLGAMPRAVYTSLEEYADTWAARGVRAWGEGWWDLNIAVGNKIGRIIGAKENTISVHQNVSLVMGILLSAMTFTPDRNRVVIEGGIFPSVYYVLKGMLPDYVEIIMVDSLDNGTTIPEDRLIDAIDEKTALVVASHVLFRSAYIVDVKPVIEKAHRVGALVIVDGYHACGIIPVDVGNLGADFYIGGVLKWMCGGPGGVFLHARDDHLKSMEPRLTGWMAHRRPFGFEVDAIDFRDDAFRFLNGTLAIPSLYAIQPGINIIASVGVENIRQKSMRQTAIIVDYADKAGYPVNTVRDPLKRGGTVTINPPHAYEIAQELIARDIIVDYRPDAGVRISPHFYNSDSEVVQAVEAVDHILQSGAWQKHTATRKFVT